MPRSVTSVTRPLTPRELEFAIQVRADLASGSARRRRESTKICLAALAPLIGVSPQALSQWERKKRVPNDRHAVAYGRQLAKLEAAVARAAA